MQRCTHAEASRRLKITPDTLKKLKEKGADGFRFGKVYTDELQAWIAANKSEFIQSGLNDTDTDEKRDLMLRKLEAEAEHIETKVAILRRDYVPHAEITELIISAITKMKSQVFQFQVRESPALLRGLDADQIRTIQKRRFDQLCELMREIPEQLDQIGKSRLSEPG